MFNTTTMLWHCCGTRNDGQPACDQPTDETFRAPAPEQLAIFDVSSMTLPSILPEPTSTSSSTSAASSTNLATATSSNDSPHESNTSHAATSELSKGAKAGISVGVIFGVALMLLLSAILYRIIKKQNQAARVPSVGQLDGEQTLYETTAQQRMSEMQGQSIKHELDSDRRYSELPDSPSPKGEEKFSPLCVP